VGWADGDTFIGTALREIPLDYCELTWILLYDIVKQIKPNLLTPARSHAPSTSILVSFTNGLS
jgi:hypothetical protein